MDSDSIRKELVDLPFFQSLTTEVRNVLAQVIQTVSKAEHIPAGTFLFKRGSQGEDVGCIVLRGDIRVEKSGTPEIVSSAPELLGEMKQVNPDALRTANVDAVTDLDVLKFSWDAFNNGIRNAMSEPDAQTVKQAIKDYAWQHISE
jgi:CRP-like cAMP-binding protein